jgi:hypothetical protein
MFPLGACERNGSTSQFFILKTPNLLNLAIF